MDHSNKPKVILISPTAAGGAPVNARMSALKKFLISEGIDVLQLNSASSFRSSITMIRDIYSHNPDFVLLTMPPFRGWSLLFLPFVPVVIDWRDGWSIAIKSGYGGTAKPSMLKGFISRCVETISIVIGSSIITCTKGLHEYHAKVLGGRFANKVFLVENGHDLELSTSAYCNDSIRNKDKLVAICAGKFSEYGKEKCMHIIDTLEQRYSDKQVILKIVGANQDINNWVVPYACQKGLDISFCDRMPYMDVIGEIRSSDIAIAVIRDPSYDYGTKAFDYVACGTPILDVFKDSQFKDHFSGCFDTDYDSEIAYQKASSFHRVAQVEAGFGFLLDKFGLRK